MAWYLVKYNIMVDRVGKCVCIRMHKISVPWYVTVHILRQILFLFALAVAVAVSIRTDCV